MYGICTQKNNLKMKFKSRCSIEYVYSMYYGDQLPADLLDTVSSVVTPRVTRPGTLSTSIQNDTQDMTTMRMVGM